MINSVKVTNHLDESIELVLRSPEKSGLLVARITGLGPEKANIQVTDVVSNDGGIFNNARISSRNITMAVILDDNPSIEENRHKLYKYFPIKKKVKLEFYTDTRKAYIYGYVEACDIELFTKKEGANISIICPDPNFYSIEDKANGSTNFSTMEYLFEFPFENDHLSEKKIELGNYELLRANSVVYSGDDMIGVIIEMHFIGAASNIHIYNLQTQEQIFIDTDKLVKAVGSGILKGDTIKISTVKGNKYVRLTKNGVVHNILNCLGKNPSWFQLSKGDNVFSYTAESGEINIQMSISNDVSYEGL